MYIFMYVYVHLVINTTLAVIIRVTYIICCYYIHTYVHT